MFKTIFAGDEAKIQAATDIAKECADVTDADRCEAAFKYLQCSESGAKTRGVNLNVIAI